MKMFPVLWQGCSRDEEQRMRDLDCPRSVPWDFVAPHEEQAQENHQQTLSRLAQRGGLSPSELLAVVTGKGLRFVLTRSDLDCVEDLLRLLADHARSGADHGE